MTAAPIATPDVRWLDRPRLVTNRDILACALNATLIGLYCGGLSGGGPICGVLLMTVLVAAIWIDRRP